MAMRAPTHASALVTILLGGAAAAYSFLTLAPIDAVVSCLLAWTMLAVAAVDWRWLIVPDILSLPAIPAGLLASGSLLDASSVGLIQLEHLIGAAAGGIGLWLLRVLYYSLRGREGLGLGDVKLCAVAGAWTGWQGLSSVLLLAASLALTFIIALTLLNRGALSTTAKVPFGAFLAPSVWLIWIMEAIGRQV
jgi:leader peptidase (prepilin peptidase)/N-methyltransferase